MLRHVLLCLLTVSVADALQLQVRTGMSPLRQLRVPAMRAIALAGDDTDPSEPPALLRPPSRPDNLMTEAEKRRQAPVHDLKHKRGSPKIRDDEGELINKKPKS